MRHFETKIGRSGLHERETDSLSFNFQNSFFIFLNYHLHTLQKLNKDTPSKSDTSSLKHMGGLPTRKGEKDWVQNHSIKNMGCKIALMTKHRGKVQFK